MLAERVVRDWYRGAFWLTLLRPLSWLFELVVRRRRRAFLRNQDSLWRPSVPVIIVGNITLGGTGKSPLVCALVDHLQRQGLRPGVISRGYGGQAVEYPLLVHADSSPQEAGDEPVMLAQQLNCPIVVDPQRVRAAQYLLDHSDCNLIISDDGLQHYRLRRDFEIVVLDAVRGVGNGWCLPAGPLREPVSRLASVNALVSNGVWTRGKLGNHDPWQMQLEPVSVIRLRDAQPQALESLQGKKVHAVAGIGNPERFFITLRQLGCEVIPHAFADHHQYNSAELAFEDSLPILMTEKDAVKCRDFLNDRMHALQVRARLAPEFFDQLNHFIHAMKQESAPHG